MATEVVTRQKFTYPLGDVYDGEWNSDGRKHGVGRLQLADGSVYVGQFKNGLCEGYGVLKFEDGSSYSGEFSAGKYHGYGVFKRSDGMKFEGEFRDGNARGYGLITFHDGSHGRPRNEGQFEDGKVIERCKATEAISKAKHAATTAGSIHL